MTLVISEEHIQKTVIKFLRLHSSKLLKEEELDVERCSINKDLLIVGDDAEELLEDLMKEFDIKFEGLVFDKYFPSEATASMNYFLASQTLKKYRSNSIFRLFFLLETKFWRIFARKISYENLSIKDLINEINTCLAKDATD